MYRCAAMDDIILILKNPHAVNSKYNEDKIKQEI
jgi:hypothetical protein